MTQRIRVDGRAFATLRGMANVITLEEACGFLLGSHEGEDTIVTQACPVTNAAGWSGSFAIPDYEQRRIERLAQRLHLEVVGVYHSHPGGNGRLSEPDQRCLGHSELPWMIVYPAPLATDPEPLLAAYAPPSGTPISVETGEHEGVRA